MQPEHSSLRSHVFPRGGRPAALAAGCILAVLAGSGPARAAAAPALQSIIARGGSVLISAQVPAGYRHAVLEAGEAVDRPFAESLVAGSMTGASGVATFDVPNVGGFRFLRVRLGTETAVPVAMYPADGHFLVEYTGGGEPLAAEEKAGHVLSRLTYGPGPDDMQALQAEGIASFIERQLDPARIDEASNAELATREAALFETLVPREDTTWVKAGDVWRYFKGTQAPPAAWRDPSFDDAAWLQGPTGIGYGDDDDETELTDMQQSATTPGYLSVFLRRKFNVGVPADLDALILRVDYDDGFVAYLNGTEIARAGVTGNPPAHTATATDHEAGSPEEFDISQHRGLVRSGENVLAIQLHNAGLTSSDASMIPELIARRNLPLPSQKRMRGIGELQQLVHVRGVYARRQLQAVLAEFWDNHFTTDYDKVAEYLGNLRNSDARTAMGEDQAAAEAAHAEYAEYQFFHDHALGNFGDLLLYSATSPTQLIYLDNVLNVKGAANENYAREILELFGFGVDNRYNQDDIEQLAKCFTGWTVRKVWPDQKLAFPASARTPPTAANVQFEDTVLLDLGAGWKYFKGKAEPSPAAGAGGGATTAWAQSGFNDAAWLSGSTGIGYGDGDDATTLSDMRQTGSNAGYFSVYLRREFTIDDPTDAAGLLLSVDYDDGYVAYLNGTEVARSQTMNGTGTPPPFNRASAGSHEAGGDPETVSLSGFANLLRPAPQKNVLAIQAHNITKDSSDLSILPRIVRRRLLPGSIENGDANGLWAFRFNPARHDTGAKVLFKDTPYQMNIPAGRTGLDGLKDALDVVDSFVNHPSVAEFICLKLINKFVSDEITLNSYHDGTAPPELRQLLDEAITAWKSTQPAGNIATVLRAILRPTTQDGLFWARAMYRSKVKSPVEFINSSVRALRASVSGTGLPLQNEQMGMHLFNRDDPDGWSEMGHDWIDTGTLLARLQFAQNLPADKVNNVRWDAAAWIRANSITTAESVIDYFDRVLFQGRMSVANRALLVKYATTDDAGNPLPFAPTRSDHVARVRELVGIILSMPQWHYQ